MTSEPVVPVRRDRATQVLFIIAALVAVGGIAFAVGRVTAPPPVSAAAANRGFGAFGGFRGEAGNGAGGGLGRGFLGGGGATIKGTVESISGSSLTLKLADGSTVTVNLAPTTTFHRQAAATSSDVQAGGEVQVGIQFQPRPAGSGAPVGAAPVPSGAPRTFEASDVTIVAP